MIDERAELERAIRRFRPDPGIVERVLERRRRQQTELARSGGDRGGRHRRGDGRRRGRSAPSEDGARP